MGVRAPKLDRPMPKKWTKPRPLFNGKDLTGWEPIGNVDNNKWVARDGELVNDNPEVHGQRGPGAANLKTTEKFQDFKLHIEVDCPEHGNSGIYLRGRYEIQVGTEGGSQPSHEMGAVYSHYPPPEGAELGLGKWTAFDITLVGRHVTVVRDGKMYHDNVEIPGPTGGALDSNEAEPGPFLPAGRSPRSDPLSQHYHFRSEEVIEARAAFAADPRIRPDLPSTPPSAPIANSPEVLRPISAPSPSRRTRQEPCQLRCQSERRRCHSLHSTSCWPDRTKVQDGPRRRSLPASQIAMPCC